MLVKRAQLGRPERRGGEPLHVVLDEDLHRRAADRKRPPDRLVHATCRRHMRTKQTGNANAGRAVRRGRDRRGPRGNRFCHDNADATERRHTRIDSQPSILPPPGLPTGRRWPPCTSDSFRPSMVPLFSDSNMRLGKTAKSCTDKQAVFAPLTFLWALMQSKL